MLNTQHIQNMTDLRLNPGKILNLLKDSDSPVYIFNRGKPASVMLSVKFYEEMVDKLEDAMDALEMKMFERQPKKKGDWISHEKLVKKFTTA